MSLDDQQLLPLRERTQRLFAALASLPHWLQYVTAIIVVTISTLLLIALQHFVAAYDGIKRGPAFVALYFIAIAVSTIVGGIRAGLLAVLLALGSTAYFLIPAQRLSFQPTMVNLVTLGIVVIVGSLVALGMDAYRNNTQLLLQNLSLLADEQARADQETVLNKIGQEVRTAKTPENVQRVAVSSVGEIIKANRCCYVTYNPARDIASITQNWTVDGLNETAKFFRPSELGLDLDSLYKHGSTVVVDDVRTHPSFQSSAHLLEANGIRSAIIVPLTADGQLESTLVVAMTASSRHWTSREVALVEAVALQTHLAVDAARVHQKEHNIAVQLQAALQPELTIDVDGLNIASFYRAALEEANVGGDFFDAFALPDGQIAFVVGDVSGKGLAAASQVAAIRHMLRCLLQITPNIVSAVDQLNTVLIEQNLLPSFATLFVAVFKPDNLMLEYVSCGHEPGLIRRPGSSEQIIQLPATGPVIGVFDQKFGLSVESLFGSGRYQLEPGDTFLLYTDGVCDAGVDLSNLLGVDGIVTMLRSFYDKRMDFIEENSASDLVEYCVSATEQFAEGVLRDDVCLLAVVVKQDYRTTRNGLQHTAPLRLVSASSPGDGSERLSYTDEIRRQMLADVLKLATRGKLRIVAGKDDLPVLLTNRSEPVRLDVGENVRHLRRTVRSASSDAGLSIEHSDSLEMAAGEAANNSLVHGLNGIGYVSWAENGSVQVRIEDSGSGIPYEDLPRATLERGYTTAGTLGQGFWIILQSVKRCWIATSGSGTTVVLEQDNDDVSAEALPVSILI